MNDFEYTNKKLLEYENNKIFVLTNTQSITKNIFIEYNSEVYLAQIQNDILLNN